MMLTNGLQPVLPTPRSGMLLRRGVGIVMAGLIATTLGACAPDAWRPDPQYNAFLDRVQNECPYFHIGNDSGRETFNDSLFLDQTSMLFHGKISEADWRTSMYSEFNTGPDDPGIACLLSKLPAKPVPAYGAPVGIPPVESPPPAASPSTAPPAIRY